MDNQLYSEGSLKILLDFIHEKTGLYYENGMVDLVADKLFPLLTDKGLESFLDYYYLLKYGLESEQEWRRVETALAVNETYFWREYDQIETAVNILIPKLLGVHPDRPVRIWHAGCATGEEPYTLVMSLLEKNPSLLGRVEIFGTDFNLEALARARAGLYRERSFRSIPEKYKEKYFKMVDRSKFQLSDRVRSMVQFQHLNLHEPAGMDKMHSFDIIFCRNVFIYFSKEAIQRTVEHFYKSMREPGFLLIGAAESLLKVTTQFEFLELNRTYLYKKVVNGRETL